MHASLQGIDQTAADSVWHVFKMVKDALDQGIRDRFKLAQVCDAFRVYRLQIESEYFALKKESHLRLNHKCLFGQGEKGYA